MAELEIDEYYAELTLCDAKINLAKAEIHKYQIKKKQIQKIYNKLQIQKIVNDYSNNKSDNNTNENVSEVTEYYSLKSFDTEVTESKCIVPPKDIKDSDMEKSYEKYFSHFDYKHLDDLEKIFNEGKWTRDKFELFLKRNEMTMDLLNEMWDNTLSIDYNYGDVINFGHARFGDVYFIGKNGVLYPNPDNNDSYALSVPLVITQYLYDAVSKYGSDANDIDIGHKDILFKKYQVDVYSEEHFKRNYYYLPYEEELYYKDENGKEIEVKLKKSFRSDSDSEVEELDVEDYSIEDLKDKTIVFTGGKDKDLIKLLEPVNVKIGSTISKNTFALICKSKDEVSTKLTKAKDLDICVYTLDEFKNKFNL